MPKLTQIIEAKDNASAVIGKASENYVAAAKKMLGSDEAIAQATKTASRAKMEALTLSQKMKFAVAKEAAAGDKLQLNLVNQKEKLAKLERQLRSAIKHGDDNAQGLAKQVAEQRKHVSALEDDTKAQKDNNETKEKAKKVVAALGAAAAAAAAGMFLLTKRTAEQGDDMIKSAQRLGLTVEQYQRLGFAMKISGTTIEDQRGSMVRFARTARDAAGGVKIARDAFERLGVSVKDDAGNFKGTNELLLEVSNNFKNMPQSVEKTALAMDLFGRSGSALTQFLNLGTAGIVELGDEAERLGGVMSTAAAQEGEQFVDALTRLGTAATGAARDFGESMAPAISRSVNQMTASVGELKKQWSEAFAAMGGFTKDSPAIINTFALIAKGGTMAASGVLIAWNLVKAAFFETRSALVGMQNAFTRFANKMRVKAGLAPILKEIPDNFQASADAAWMATAEIEEAMNATTKAIDDVAAAALGQGDALGEGAKATDDAAEASKRQAEQLRKQAEATKAAADATKALEKAEKDLNDKRAAHLASFVSGRAKAREANLKLHEDILKKTQAETDASIKQSARMAESLGAAMGTALAEVARGTGDVKDVFKAMAQSTVRAIQQVVSALLIKAATNAGSTAAAFGPIAAAGAASATFAMLSGVIAGFKDGGIVPGTGSGDVVPAMLEPGELVLPKAMASDLLQIAGKTTTGHFNEGGRVGRGGAGALAVHFHEGIMPRSPAELDRYVRDKLAPSLRRLKRQGAIA